MKTLRIKQNPEGIVSYEPKKFVIELKSPKEGSMLDLYPTFRFVGNDLRELEREASREIKKILNEGYSVDPDLLSCTEVIPPLLVNKAFRSEEYREILRQDKFTGLEIFDPVEVALEIEGDYKKPKF